MVLHTLLQSLKKNKRPQRIYLDYAGATPISRSVVRAMYRVYARWGNPGAPHAEGMQAKETLNKARADIAKVLAVKPQELIFTSGATEANNLALIGVLRSIVQKDVTIRPHIISTAIEHSSVHEVLLSKEVQSIADVTFIGPNAHGEITAPALEGALRAETRLISIGWANGEIGTIQPLRALSTVIRDYEKKNGKKIIFHADAGQSAFAVAPQPHGVQLDMLTLSSGKLYGPRGVAVLYVKSDTPIMPILYGGGQERGLRAGTEDPVLATGFAVALTELEREREREFGRQRELRNTFIRQLRTAFPESCINGTGKHQLAHIVNVSIPAIDGEYIMLALDHHGIACSTKSICLLQEGDPESPVVKALGGEPWRCTTTLRFSYGKGTSESDMSVALATLKDVVAKYTQIS